MTIRPTKIDVDKIDLDREKIKTTGIPGSITYPHTSGSAVVKPEDKGKIKGRSMAAMKEQTNLQMRQIYRQMQLLADQVKEIQERVQISERIYLSQMNFEPVIGMHYYFYQRKDGSDCLSMIAPDEWGRSFPFEKYLAKVKLLADHTWEILEHKNFTANNSEFNS
jgi:hypothetical protein